jgi:hypothetical protein
MQFGWADTDREGEIGGLQRYQMRFYAPDPQPDGYDRRISVHHCQESFDTFPAGLQGGSPNRTDVGEN